MLVQSKIPGPNDFTWAILNSEAIAILIVFQSAKCGSSTDAEADIQRALHLGSCFKLKR